MTVVALRPDKEAQVSEVATDEERAAAHRRLVEMTLDEFRRVVIAINIDDAIGMKPGLTLKLNRYGGPELVLDEEHLTGLQLAQLQQLAGQNLDVELHDSRVVVFCPSWPPDRLPF